MLVEEVADRAADQAALAEQAAGVGALRDARASFFDNLVNAARSYASENGLPSLSPDHVDVLRSEEVFQVAEFYYLVKKFDLGDPRRVRPFLLRHNDDINKLIADKERRHAQGLTESRLKEAFFSEVQIEAMVSSGERLRNLPQALGD